MMNNVEVMMGQPSALDVIVVGGANTDYLVWGPKLPDPGETIEGEGFQEGSGGKGANQAVAAARLQAHVALVACLGADERGDQLLEDLASASVDTQYIRRDNTAVTGAALIMVEQGGQKQILAAPGANHHLSVSDILLATEAISTTKVLLAPLEVPLPVLVAAMRLAREANAQIVLDAGPPTSLDDDLLHMVDVLRANAGEAEKLTGIQVQNRKSARQAGDNLRGRGVGATIIQAGEEGNLLVWSQGERLLPLLEVDSVDTTGAGDAFAGALAVALAEGQSLVQAAEFANVAAALATTKIGAQAALPRRDEIAAFLESET